MIVIKGVPLQKQSMKVARLGGFVRSYQPKKVTDWCAQARLQILEQLPEGYVPIDGEINIGSIRFIFPTLKSWSKKKMKHLEEGFKIYKTTKPDIDNLMKNLFDVCNGIVWIDDARIVEIEHIEKIYGKVPRIELEVNTFGNTYQVP